jgi:phosphonate transport system ATP-binding protein
MIRLSNISRHYGDIHAVDGVDLSVDTGERIAVIGPSGAGKTTLLRLLSLATRPTAGSYILSGRDTGTLQPPQLRTARAEIAMIHQHHDLVGRMSVLRNVLAGRLGRWSWMEGTRAFVWPADADVREVHAILDRVGIPEKLHSRVDEVSGGQQQRVAIARAIFQDARLLLADEPIASLDPALAEEIISLLVRAATEDGRTLIVNLHQTELASRYFDRIIAFRDGRVVFDRSASQVTKSHFTELFSGEATQVGRFDDQDQAEELPSLTVRTTDG